MFLTDISSTLLLGAQLLFVISALIFALSAVDDLAFDLRFYLWKLRQALAKEPDTETPPIPLDGTPDAQQNFAIMLPAWQESNVLFDSVANMVRSIDYARYHIFIGVYPNDPATCAEAEKLAQRFTHVHKVVTRDPGPTCKADCLNQIVQRIRVFEQRHGLEFAACVIQDAEDSVHPDVLKHFNRLIPEYDIVQIPVFSLPRKWHQFTAGHYMDEFAESHNKDVPNRASLSGVVPGAGVGTAYSRKTLLTAALGGQCFNTGSLTEDYEFSLRLRDSSLRMLFSRSRADIDNPRLPLARQLIATREYFPDRFWAAVRQKTRWNIGIALQGWENFGWRGDWKTRYLFWRDRKPLLLGISSTLGLAVLALTLLAELATLLQPAGQHQAPFLEAGNPAWYLVYLNVGATLLRLAQRHYWSWSVYGWSVLPALSLRFLWSGIINYCAAVRSMHIYLRQRLRGEALGWDKTRHDYPHLIGLASLKQRLGEELVQRDLLSADALDAALLQQQLEGGQLGQILVASGAIQEAQLMKILGSKYQLQTRDVDPFAIAPELYTAVPFTLLRRHQVVPLRWDGNTLELATSRILASEAVEELESHINAPVRLLLATQASLFFSLHTFSRLATEQQQRSTGGHFTTRLLGSKSTEAAQPHPESHSLFSGYLPFGQYLLQQQRLLPKELDAELQNAAAANKSLGQHLVDSGRLSAAERDQIVLEIEKNYRRLVREYMDSLTQHADAPVDKGKLARG